MLKTIYVAKSAVCQCLYEQPYEKDTPRYFASQTKDEGGKEEGIHKGKEEETAEYQAQTASKEGEGSSTIGESKQDAAQERSSTRC